jgi:hypothetical protein
MLKRIISLLGGSEPLEGDKGNYLSQQMTTIPLAKNPWIAAALNFFFYGLGYVYLGKRVIFGVVLFVANIAFIAGLFYGLTLTSRPA